MSDAPHLLVIDSRFYENISDELFLGARLALEKAGATFDRVSVPGVLEIPAAMSMALAAPPFSRERSVAWKNGDANARCAAVVTRAFTASEGSVRTRSTVVNTPMRSR